MQETPFDPAMIRNVVLATALSWMTVDDIQREVSAERERLNHKPFHCPIQKVQQTLLQMVEQGSVSTKQDNGAPMVYRVERRAVVRRRSKVLQHLLFNPVHEETEANLIEKTGCTHADLQELDGHALISLRPTDGGAIAVLTQTAHVELAEKGSYIIVSDRMPDEEKAVGEEFARKAVAQLEVARDRTKAAETKFERLKNWLAANGVHDVAGIIEPPPPPRGEETFEYVEHRKIDDAENGRILKEVLALEEQRSIVELRLDGSKAQAKADLQRIDAEISTLKSFAQCNERVVSTLATKEIDWAKGLIITWSAVDGRELHRAPIPKGTQRALPATKSEPVPDKAAPDAEVPKPELKDLSDAVIAVLRAAGEEVLTLSEVTKKVHDGHVIAMTLADFEPEVKAELGRLVKSKVAKKVRGAWVLAANVEPPAAPAAGEDGSAGEDPNVEPGPLASPEQRRRGKGKSGEDARP